MIRYQSIKSSDDYFNQVVLLGNKNSKTLGMLPKGALKQYAEKDLIIAAVQHNKVLGYILFAITQRNSRIRIIHLCISELSRKSGIATSLLDTLKDRYLNSVRGMILSCREDYRIANQFWKKYGFKPMTRVRSRAKAERYLKKWWFDFGHHDLFTIANSNSEKAKVLLDTSIIVKLRDDNQDEVTGSKFLLDDWIVDEVDYYYASEIYNEIDRDDDTDRADLTKRFITGFKKTLVNPTEVKSIFSELLEIVKGSSKNDLSDKKQIAECISGGLDYFITTDNNLLDHEAQLYDKYKIYVLSPTEFILMIDKLVNSLNYNSARLAGANYEYRNPNSADIKNIIEAFLHKAEGEKKSEFRECLTKHVGDVVSSRLKIVQDKESYKGLWFAQLTDGAVKVKLLRTTKDKLSNPLFNQLLNNILTLAVDLDKREIIVEEKFLNPNQLSILEHYGFNQRDKAWHKLIFNTITSSRELVNIAKNENELEYLEKIQTKLNNSSGMELIHLVERKLWPLKFDNIDIPTYIVPIKPYWASQLFDHIAASSTMFGSQPHLVWNRENIYYRSVNPVSESNPARILWYVSNSKSGNIRNKSIVACSYLDDVVIDEAKKLFKQYKAYGIYEWADIYKLAKKDIRHPIKALRFSDTEVFSNPIKLDRINEILTAHGRRENTFPSPLEVTNAIFIAIYKER